MRLPLRLLLALMTASLLAGCGFHLRGKGGSTLPYRTMHIALPETAEVRVWLERHIQASGSTSLVASAPEAEAVFQQLADSRKKSILSVNAQGRVREYRLELSYRFRLVNGKGEEIVAPNEISLHRDITYNDSQVLSKDLEESLLWRDMTSDLVSQMMRRLSIIKPKDPTRDDD